MAKEDTKRMKMKRKVQSNSGKVGKTLLTFPSTLLQTHIAADELIKPAYKCDAKRSTNDKVYF